LHSKNPKDRYTGYVLSGKEVQEGEAQEGHVYDELQLVHKGHKNLFLV
jgi:hypothetical protein